MAIDFKDSISDPPAVDVGNKTTQGMTVSKTIKLGLFTTNENAVWGARNQLRKESFPFAIISIPANRDIFMLQVGDIFKYSYSKHSVTDMIFRVLNIEESELNSEKIIIHAVEDIFASTHAPTNYTTPEDNKAEIPDYASIPILYQNVIEAPYVVSGNDVGIIPIAVRSADNQIGFVLYMSSDGGSSYDSIGTYNVFAAYGELVNGYPVDTYQIDDVGMTVDFVNDDIDQFENLTRQNLLGIKNLAVIDGEIMTIQTITPVSGGTGKRYQLAGVYRGRFDTKMEYHASGDGIYLFNGEHIRVNTNADLLPGTSRKFKFVPFNSRKTGDISDSLVTDLTIESRSRKPYEPINLRANGDVYFPTYTNDVALTWSPRVRGDGAGVYAPASTDKAISWEGYFEVEVWVSSVLVRTATAINDDTWTYTSAMNTSDNGSLASQIEFKVKNYIEYETWDDGESSQVEITVEKES